MLLSAADRDDPLLTSPKDKLLHLEGLRGLACVIVIIHHYCCGFWPVFIGTDVAGQGKGNWAMAIGPLRFFWAGRVAVSVFFALSGFVLSAKFFKTGSVNALVSSVVRRYFRLLIPVVASSFIFFLMFHVEAFRFSERASSLSGSWWLGSYAKRIVFKEFMSDIFLLLWLRSSGASGLNNVLWTMAFEFQGSLAVFLLALIVRRVHRRQLLVGSVLVYCLFPYTARTSATLLFYATFFFGVAMAQWHFSAAIDAGTMDSRVQDRAIKASSSPGCPTSADDPLSAASTTVPTAAVSDADQAISSAPLAEHSPLDEEAKVSSDHVAQRAQPSISFGVTEDLLVSTNGSSRHTPSRQTKAPTQQVDRVTIAADSDRRCDGKGVANNGSSAPRPSTTSCEAVDLKPLTFEVESFNEHRTHSIHPPVTYTPSAPELHQIEQWFRRMYASLQVQRQTVRFQRFEGVLRSCFLMVLVIVLYDFACVPQIATDLSRKPSWWIGHFRTAARYFELPLDETSYPLVDLASWLYSTLAAMLMLWFVLLSSHAARFLSWSPIVYVGKISFSLYLLHVPLLYSFASWSVWSMVMQHGTSYNTAVNATMVCYSALLWPSAHLFWRFVDSNAIGWSAVCSRFLFPIKDSRTGSSL